MTDQEKIFYALGRVDQMANILMEVRVNGERKALLELSEELLKIKPDHPHALKYLEEYK